MVDLGELVADTVQGAQMVGSQVEFEGASSLPVEVDPVGMRRLLDNLLENATKYGEHGVRLSVRDGEAVAESSTTARASPRTSGARVRALLPHRGRAQIRQAGQRAGACVCRSIARAHGGDVWCWAAARKVLWPASVPLVMGVGRRAA
jgi:signal transduction histidine kinase